MTSTATLTLADFLLARIAEDEEVAREAVAQVTKLDDAFTEPGAEPWGWRGYSRPGASLVGSGPVRDHIARHDPTRVLAECEAKRRLVEHCEPDLIAAHPGDPYVLRLLAFPYADHPDYREEWKP